MRIAEVIGTVTLSRACPTLANSRWIVAVPFSLKSLQAGAVPDGEDLVVYDNLGAGNGNRIGISEGAEAAVPFYPVKQPIDAYCACILDAIAVGDAL